MNADCCQIDRLPLGVMRTNTYIVRPIGETVAWVFDPGMGDMTEVLDRVARDELAVERILLTHGHGDHIAGIGQLKRAWPEAIITAPAGDAHMLTDAQANLSAPFGMAVTALEAEELIEPGQILTLGETRWQVLDTSGHTPGGVSYLCRQTRVVIVGDALFAGSIGRCDIPEANLGRLVANIRKNLMSLDDEIEVLCGHGPPTRIGVERSSNPYLPTARRS